MPGFYAPGRAGTRPAPARAEAPFSEEPARILDDIDLTN
jgi:hypothetical protein